MLRQQNTSKVCLFKVLAALPKAGRRWFSSPEKAVPSRHSLYLDHAGTSGVGVLVDFALGEAAIDDAETDQADDQEQDAHIAFGAFHLVDLGAQLVVPVDGVDAEGDDGEQEGLSAAGGGILRGKCVGLIGHHDEPVDAVDADRDDGQDNTHRDRTILDLHGKTLLKNLD